MEGCPFLNRESQEENELETASVFTLFKLLLKDKCFSKKKVEKTF